MVIKLQNSKKKTVPAPQPPQTRFTLKDIDDLFSQTKNWNVFYKENQNKLHRDKLDVYEWCVYPLHHMEGKVYRCVLHPMVEVDAGDKKYNFRYENIHYSEFISHCIFYKPEEHKQYIIEKLFKNHVSK